MSTPSARTGGSLDAWFKISQRGSTVRQEVVAGLTTFLAMVYSVIVVPGMLGKAGFPPAAVFVATCLVAGLGSIVMGLWANLPLAIGCAISLTAFTAFSLVLGQHISVPVALGAVFLMGVLFTVISATGIRSWILRNLPHGVAHGTGIGIGLFLLLIAANGVGLVIKNPLDGLPVALGDFTTFPVMMSLVGLAVIIGLEKLKVPGGILLTIIGISIVGLIFDPNVHFSGVFAMPSLSDENGNSLIGSLDIMGALNPVVLPSVLALVMTAVFDATGTIRAVAGQANLLDKDGQIILYNDMLSEADKGKILSIRGIQDQLEVCIGDRLLYQYKDNRFEKNRQMKGKIWADISLPEKIGQEVLSISYETKKNARLYVYAPMIGEFCSVFRQHLLGSIFSILVVLGMTGLGIVSVIVFFYTRYRQIVEKRFLNVALFLLLCSL